MSRILTTVAAFAATTLMSSAAFAGCNNGTYCNSNAHSSVSMYETSPSYSTSGYTTSSNHSTSPMYNTAYSYGVNNSYGGVMSSSAADATYGTGSISNAYTGGDVELYNFSGSTGSVAGLGMNESLQPTTCPVSVHNPSGARVLGCSADNLLPRRTPCYLCPLPRSSGRAILFRLYSCNTSVSLWGTLGASRKLRPPLRLIPKRG